MACSSCQQNRARTQLLAKGVTESEFDVGGEETILALYTSPNIAMHRVHSPTGGTLNGMPIDYGRHRGASAAELTLYESGELTPAKARELKAIPFSVFQVHPLDIQARPDLFSALSARLVKEEAPVEAAAEEVVQVEPKPSVEEGEVAALSESSVSIVDEFEHKYLTKSVANKLSKNGKESSVTALASMSAEELSEYISPKSRGKGTTLAKATEIIDAAKSFLG